MFGDMLYWADLEIANKQTVRAPDGTDEIRSAVIHAASEIGVMLNDLPRIAVDLARYRPAFEACGIAKDPSDDAPPPLYCDVGVISYVELLLHHPSMNPRIFDRLGADMKARIEYLRSKSWASETQSAPVWAPVGVSFFLRTKLENGRCRVLLAVRNDRVAVNPGVLQSTLDEGMRDDTVRGIAMMGLMDEYGLPSRDAARLCDLMQGRAACAGLFVAPGGVDGVDARSGVNRIYEIVVSDAELDFWASHLEAHVAKLDRSPELERPLVTAKVSSYEPHGGLEFNAVSGSSNLPAGLAVSEVAQHYFRYLCGPQAHEGER